jgi:hypothetical protein
LVPVRKQPGLKVGAFSPALLVPVATTGTNGPYKPGLMVFFPPVNMTRRGSMGARMSVGAAERVSGWCRRVLGLELAARHHQHCLSVPRDTIRYQAAARRVRRTNHVNEEYNDVEVASLASAVKRLWRACPRPQAWLPTRGRWRAATMLIFLLPAPTVFSCRGCVAQRGGLGSGWGSLRRQVLWVAGASWALPRCHPQPALQPMRAHRLGSTPFSDTSQTYL